MWDTRMASRFWSVETMTRGSTGDPRVVGYFGWGEIVLENRFVVGRLQRSRWIVLIWRDVGWNEWSKVGKTKTKRSIIIANVEREERAVCEKISVDCCQCTNF